MFPKGFPRDPLTIRQWSVLLVVACILPATIATTLLIYSSYKRERAGIEHATIEIARALMQTIDRELSSAEGASQVLATSPYLSSGDLAAFYRQAEEALNHRGGVNLVLADVSGQELLDMLERFGAPLPMHGNPQQIRRVAESGRPMVSDLYVGAAHRLVTSVDVPVQRAGGVKYVLSMQFFPERLGEILTGQHVPEGWVATILDSSGAVVARTREPARFLGQHTTPALARKIAQSAEGSVEDRTLEGIPSVAVFSRSQASKWTVVIGMHLTTLMLPLWKTLSWIVGGALLLVMLGFWLARSIGERVTTSIRGLVEPAIALGHGKPVTIPSLYLREARDVGDALLQASDLLRLRTAERDLAERKEHDLREAKQKIVQSEVFLRGVFEQTLDAVFLVAPNGRVVRANAEAERLFGYDQDGFGALAIDDLLFDPQSDSQHALRATLFATSTRSAVGDGGQLQARRADATVFPVDVTVSPLRKSEDKLVIATVRDVTERERAGEELIVLNRRLALATRAGGIAVWEWNLVSGALVWDERMYDLYQLPPERASGHFDMWRERLHPDDLERVERELDEALVGNKDFAAEFRIVWPDGQIRIVRAKAIVSRDAAGNPVRVTGVNIDITESRRKEGAIGAALREKETLLKELYHRVKNNLQIVASLFNLQLRALPDGPARTALSEGVDRVRAMALVHEKLYQSGNLASIALDIYIADLCTQLGRAASAERRGISLRTEVPPMEIGLDIAVPLGLLLNELISNSLKHAFPDERTGWIVVRVEHEAEGMVRISVCDNGVGFPRGIDSTNSPTLGLKLIAALSGQLGGHFSLEGGDGACVSVVLPLNGRVGMAQVGMGEKDG